VPRILRLPAPEIPEPRRRELEPLTRPAPS